LGKGTGGGRNKTQPREKPDARDLPHEQETIQPSSPVPPQKYVKKDNVEAKDQEPPSPSLSASTSRFDVHGLMHAKKEPGLQATHDDLFPTPLTHGLNQVKKEPGTHQASPLHSRTAPLPATVAQGSIQVKKEPGTHQAPNDDAVSTTSRTTGAAQKQAKGFPYAHEPHEPHTDQHDGDSGSHSTELPVEKGCLQDAFVATADPDVATANKAMRALEQAFGTNHYLTRHAYNEVLKLQASHRSTMWDVPTHIAMHNLAHKQLKLEKTLSTQIGFLCQAKQEHENTIMEIERIEATITKVRLAIRVKQDQKNHLLYLSNFYHTASQ
jgi:hypothetical protein